MANPDNAGYYFQTSDSLATSQRKAVKARNKYGDPIRLSAKVLAVEDGSGLGGDVLVALATGEVKKVDVDDSEVTSLPVQAGAPLTSITTSRNEFLYCGCWNKQIYGASVDPALSLKSAPRLTNGHTDFVKCVLIISLLGLRYLVSGGADSAIIVWDLDSGKILHKLKGHTKGVQDLVRDPEGEIEGSSCVIYSASSDREIRRWHISKKSAHELPKSLDKPILAHETSVYKLRFDSEGDLWTASADKTAKHLVRDREWEADTVLQHPDFVRDIIIVERAGLVVTACRDEEVRVWDMSSGDLLCTYSGHFEEVTGLALVHDGTTVVSVSIDGTVRSWGLGQHDMKKYLEDVKRERDRETEAPNEAPTQGVLTADEEAELAELMDDDN